eukprot:GHVL01018220.1.p2 GENE.GHVL01018220.1~~GHVL01018220.1.p2  ORF type:complete len:191 (-),score=46.20 GHVL01018220.1:278-850(-)
MPENKLIDLIEGIIIEYGFNGIDVSFTDELSWSNENNGDVLLNAIKKIRNKYFYVKDHYFNLSMSTYYKTLQSGDNGYINFKRYFDSWKPDILNCWAYGIKSTIIPNIPDPNNKSAKTDFLFSLVSELVYPDNDFINSSPNQIVLGLPANIDAAQFGNEFENNDILMVLRKMKNYSKVEHNKGGAAVYHI